MRLDGREVNLVRSIILSVMLYAIYERLPSQERKYSLILECIVKCMNSEHVDYTISNLRICPTRAILETDLPACINFWIRICKWGSFLDTDLHIWISFGYEFGDTNLHMWISFGYEFRVTNSHIRISFGYEFGDTNSHMWISFGYEFEFVSAPPPLNVKIFAKSCESEHFAQLARLAELVELAHVAQLGNVAHFASCSCASCTSWQVVRVEQDGQIVQTVKTMKNMKTMKTMQTMIDYNIQLHPLPLSHSRTNNVKICCSVLKIFLG